MSGRELVAIFAFAALSSAAAAAGDQSGAAPAVQPRRPSASVICIYMVVTSLAEVGRQCRAGQHADFQAELERAESRLDTHVLANSSVTRAQIEQFKLRERDADNPNLCGRMRSYYDAFAAGGAEGLRSELDWILANRRTIEEGDCL